MFDNVDIKKFTRRFYEIYGELYDSGFSDFGETNRMFDTLCKFSPERRFIQRFNEERQDFISSDREVCAFIRALLELAV